MFAEKQCAFRLYNVEESISRSKREYSIRVEDALESKMFQKACIKMILVATLSFFIINVPEKCDAWIKTGDVNHYIYNISNAILHTSLKQK